MRAVAIALLAFIAVSVALVQAHFTPHALSKINIENIQFAEQTNGTITIDAPILNGTGNWVTVSWSNVGSTWPGNWDWIGVYSPAPANFSATVPAKYKYVIPDGSGSGSTQLWLLNMRDSYTVAYFTGGMSAPTLLAVSAPVQFSNYHLPLGIHLALTNKTSEMRVTWNSKGNMFPSVSYGVSADKLNNTIMRVHSYTYTASDMCGPPATTTGWRAPGFLHTAVMTDLRPSTTYYYQVGDESSGSKSDILSFRSPPAVAAATDVDFFIFGDLGQVELDGSNEASQMDGSILTTTAMQADMEGGGVDLSLSPIVVHIGDISYARGYATLWEQFHYQISNISQALPWMTCDGNHERDYPHSGSRYTGRDSGGECGVAYENRFIMPGTSKDQTWSTFTYGSVAFVLMSTEHDFQPGSLQYTQLEQYLSAVDRTKTPFLLFAGHRPMYIDSTGEGTGGDQPVAAELRQYIEPLLVQYRVDVALWGHHHSAQRTCPVVNQTCAASSDDAPVHIVTGAAGAGFSTNIEIVKPSWIEFVEDSVHGYIRAKVRGNYLQMDFISGNDRSVLDTVTIPAKKFTDRSLPLQQQQKQGEDEWIFVGRE